METDIRSAALARHYLSIGQPDKALAILERGSPDFEDCDYWYLRGQALYDLKRPADAEEAARQGLARAPDSVPLLYLLANTRAQQGDLPAAETALLAALQLEPEDPGLLCRYALLVARAGQIDKAEQLVEEAGRIAPDAAVVARCRVILAYLRGNDRETVRQGQALLAGDPEDAFGHYMLGASLLSADQVQGAGVYLRNAARLNPEANELVAAARYHRFASHLLLWPLRPFIRLGTARTWLLAMAILLGLRMLRLYQFASIFALLYIALCIYSWVVPPLLKRWLQRQGYRFE